MTQEITKKQICILLKNKLQVWVDADKEQIIINLLDDKDKSFIQVDGQIINKYEISGIYTPDKIQDIVRLQNGDWKCSQCGEWNKRNEKCQCEIKRLSRQHLDAFPK